MIKRKFKQTEIGKIPEDWEVKELKDVASYISNKVNINEFNLTNFISTENMLPNLGGINEASSLPKTGKFNKFNVKDILFSNIRNYFKKLWLAKFNGACSNDVLVIRPKNSSIETSFLYYYLSQERFFEYTMLTSKGTKMPRGDKQAILNWAINIPPLSEQHSIARILSSLDAKIELNNKMNKTLEAIGQALFKRWFVDFDEVPGGWYTKPLDKVAEFLNGLALQKYPAMEGEEYLPAIKIRELRSGITEQTDKVSLNLPKGYIVEDGDMLFSWSGSLEVVIWTNGKGALNQHLFKVSSQDYPKWFYYYWTKYHLPHFRHIAEGKATTMGHIQKHNLSEAEVLVPDKKTFDEMNKIMNPILNKVVALRLEANNLAKIRDSLLPKLMSGDIRTI